MGGGGLRILGHKKWHVWRRDNIEKVEKDEREFGEKQQKLQVKRRRIEQERRIQELEVQTNATSNEHINFFKEEEQKNIHDAVSSKKKKDSTPKQVTLSQQVKTPWYTNGGGEVSVQSTHAQLERRKRELDSQDPLKKMRIEVKKTPLGLLVEQEKRRNQDLVDFAGEKIVSTKEKVSQVKKKNEKKKKKKKLEKTSHDDLIEKLRRERHARESKERKRAAELMKKH